jgi:hypothetical protein
MDEDSAGLFPIDSVFICALSGWKLLSIRLKKSPNLIADVSFSTASSPEDEGAEAFAVPLGD